MEINLNLRKGHLLLFGIILIVGIMGIALADKPTPIGHTWSEMECTTDFCVKTGKVGIGTASPGAKLEIGAPASGPTMILSRTGGESSIKSSNDQNLFLDASSSKTIGLNYFSTGPVVLAMGGGSVGIGRDPVSKLDIKGNTRITGELSMSGSGSHINLGGQNIDQVYQASIEQVVARKLIDWDSTSFYVDPNYQSQLQNVFIDGQLCFGWPGTTDCATTWGSGGGGEDCSGCVLDCNSCDAMFLNDGTGSVTSNNIADGTITAADIADTTIGSTVTISDALSTGWGSGSVAVYGSAVNADFCGLSGVEIIGSGDCSCNAVRLAVSSWQLQAARLGGASCESICLMACFNT